MPILQPDSTHHIIERIESACARCNRSSSEITLVGASKKVEAARLATFINEELDNFGENYIQEGIGKAQYFEEKGLKAHWHFIGALQSNKAREAVRYFELIHSVDRLSLARELDKEASRIGKIQRILIQVNVGGENSKAGVKPVELGVLFAQVQRLGNLKVEGLMSLPPYMENPEESRPFHRKLRELRDSINGPDGELPFLSMGMSNDFEVAIEEGATHIRIGTALFGERG
jgi:pyridoxal phosphate enzyme (YggS family)